MAIQQSIGGVMVSIAGSIPGQCNFSPSLRSAFLVGMVTHLNMPNFLPFKAILSSYKHLWGINAWVGDGMT